MERTRESDEEKKKLWKDCGIRSKSCYEFILNVVKLKNENVRFITSHLVFSEIFNTLYGEAFESKWEAVNKISSLKEEFGNLTT